MTERFSISEALSDKSTQLLEPPSLCWYVSDFLSTQKATQLLERLSLEVQWRQPSVRLFGREVKQPRLVAWHGDPGCRYKYSGTLWEPQPWLPSLAELRSVLNKNLGVEFNSVLLNQIGRAHV